MIEKGFALKFVLFEFLGTTEYLEMSEIEVFRKSEDRIQLHVHLHIYCNIGGSINNISKFKGLEKSGI